MIPVSPRASVRSRCVLFFFLGLYRTLLQVPELHRDVARLRDRHLQHEAAGVVRDTAHDIQTAGRARHEHGRAPVEHVLHHPLHRVFRWTVPDFAFAVHLRAFRVRAQLSHERGGVVPNVPARGLGEHASAPEIRRGRHGGLEVDARDTDGAEMLTTTKIFCFTVFTHDNSAARSRPRGRSPVPRL